MVLIIPKDTPLEEVRKMVDEFQEEKERRDSAEGTRKKSMRKRYGSMPGLFGDPIAYQTMMRSEWD